MWPGRTIVLDYSTSAAVCQHRMRSGQQTSRQRWCPQGDPGDTSTTWSIVVANQVLADGAGASFYGYEDGAGVGDCGFWPNCVSYRWA